MRFYDEVRKDPRTSQFTKDLLDGCIVIDASNVAEYYYQGIDKNVWSLDDFPNIAPPFERFWLDFDAPKSGVATETQTQQWGRDMPSRWGVHCQATCISEYAEQVQTEQGRRQIKKDLIAWLLELQFSLQRQCPNISEIAHRGEEYARSHLSVDHFTLLSHVMSLEEQLELIASGHWEGVSLRFDSRWQMDVTVFCKLFVSGWDTIVGPLWTWRLYIAFNGTVARDPVTDFPLTFSSPHPQGFMQKSFERLHNSGMSAHDAWDELSRRVTPLLHTALLAISFMHCKNILMSDVVPERRVVRNKGAKRRGVQGYQPVPYKVLDISPMKQVLKKIENGMPTERDRTAKAFHICRGHFADYTEGRGLFGKYHGTFWIPQHTRGSLPRLNVRDYRLKL